MSIISNLFDNCAIENIGIGHSDVTSSSRILPIDNHFLPPHSLMDSPVISLEKNTNESVYLGLTSDNRAHMPTKETMEDSINKRTWTATNTNSEASFFREEDWESYGFEDMYSYFNCYEHARNPNKKLYNSRMWEALRKGFDQQLFFNESPYYSDYSEGKGRGAFAKRNIRKGEIVHDGLRNIVFFRDGDSWRDFIFSIPSSRMACDVLEWTWMQDVIFEGNLMLCLNLDDAAFLNNGGESESNIAPISEKSLTFYATRDIEKDEELLYDYDLYDTDWNEFGL